MAYHEPCPECGSKDNVGVFEQNKYCFGCGYYKQLTESEIVNRPEFKENNLQLLKYGQYLPLKKRGISQKTCEFYKYQVGRFCGKNVHIANYMDSTGSIASQHLRFITKKDFLWIAEKDSTELFGLSRFKPNKNIGITITEGELDALSIAEIQNCKYPVVSIRSGAGKHTINCIKENIEELSKYKEIVLIFDQDEKGKKSAIEVAELFKPGTVRIAELPLKDANEMLLAGRKSELIQAYYNAKVYRPDGIICSNEIDFNDLFKPEPRGLKLDWPLLDEYIRGFQNHRLYLFASGWGMGKSTVAKQIAYSLATTYDKKIGNLFLEEPLKTTQLSYIALDNGVLTEDLKENPDILSTEIRQKSYDKLFKKGNLYFYKHIGSRDVSDLMSKLEYLAIGCGCELIIFDHVTAAVSGLHESQGDVKAIDMLMNEMMSLVNRTNCSIITICQLVKDNKKPFHKGYPITLQDLRGSGQLAGVPDVIVAIEGNQEQDPNLRKLKVIKNRPGSQLGYVDSFRYNPNNGKLTLNGYNEFDMEDITDITEVNECEDVYLISKQMDS